MSAGSPDPVARSDLAGALARWIAALAGIGVVYALGAWMTRVLPPVDLEPWAALFYLPEVSDDRRDRYVYLASLVLAPMVAIGVSLASRRLLRPVRHAVLQGLAVVLVLVLWWAANQNLWIGGYHWAKLVGTSPWTHHAAAFVLLAGAYAARRRLRPVWVGGPFLLAGLVAATSYFGTRAIPEVWHFEPVVYGYVQTASGKGLYAGNLYSQYGGYNLLLWLVTGGGIGSLFAYKAVMASLVCVSLWALLGALRRFAATDAAFAWGAVVLLSMFDPVFKRIDVDPYYQYAPVRMLFPALLILVAAHHLQRPRLATAALGGWVASIGVFWNLDSGLVGLVSWVLVVVLAEAAGDRSVRRLALALAAIGAAVALTVGLLLAVYTLVLGARPEPAMFVEYQRIFALVGFFMLPAPTFGTWVSVAGIYLWVFALLAQQAVDGRPPVVSQFLLYLALLGAGLLSYYVGRSHDQVLSGPWYPAVMVLVLVWPATVARWTRPGAWSRVGLVGVLLVVGAVASVRVVVDVLDAADHREDAEASAAEVRELAARIRADHDALGLGETLIVSRASGTLHLQSGLPVASAWDLPSFEEIILYAQIDTAAEILRSCAVDTLLVLDGRFGLVMTHGALTGALDGYRMAAVEDYGVWLQAACGPPPVPGDRLLVLQREPDGLHRIDRPGGPFAIGAPIDSVVLPVAYTLSVEVTPGEEQPPFAVIVGNHPGYSGVGGFVIQQEAARTNTYAFQVGVPGGWSDPLRFQLDAGRLQRVEIHANGRHVVARVDGEVRGSIAQPRWVTSTPMPVAVGDLLAGGRRFAGTVHGVALVVGPVHEP